MESDARQLLLWEGLPCSQTSALKQIGSFKAALEWPVVETARQQPTDLKPLLLSTIKLLSCFSGQSSPLRYMQPAKIHPVALMEGPKTEETWETSRSSPQKAWFPVRWGHTAKPLRFRITFSLNTLLAPGAKISRLARTWRWCWWTESVCGPNSRYPISSSLRRGESPRGSQRGAHRSQVCRQRRSYLCLHILLLQSAGGLQAGTGARYGRRHTCDRHRTPLCTRNGSCYVLCFDNGSNGVIQKSASRWGREGPRPRLPMRQNRYCVTRSD